MGHSRWETYKAKRPREMEADALPHPEYEQRAVTWSSETSCVRSVSAEACLRRS